MGFDSTLGRLEGHAGAESSAFSALFRDSQPEREIRGTTRLRYRVVHGYSKPQFELLVTKTMLDGWQPVGSVNVVMSPVGASDGVKGVFMQAMQRDAVIG